MKFEFAEDEIVLLYEVLMSVKHPELYFDIDYSKVDSILERMHLSAGLIGFSPIIEALTNIERIKQI